MARIARMHAINAANPTTPRTMRFSHSYEYPFDRRNDGDYQQFRISAEAFQAAIRAKTRKAADGEASQAITLAAAFPKRPT
jgi:hypothetical protein